MLVLLTLLYTVVFILCVLVLLTLDPLLFTIVFIVVCCLYLHPYLHLAIGVFIVFKVTKVLHQAPDGHTVHAVRDLWDGGTEPPSGGQRDVK